MKTDTTYNGWTNYATWNVNLWVMNEELSYRSAMSLVPFTAQTAEDWVRNWFPDGTHDMNGAKDLDEVNWNEIAENWNED